MRRREYPGCSAVDERKGIDQTGQLLVGMYRGGYGICDLNRRGREEGQRPSSRELGRPGPSLERRDESMGGQQIIEGLP